MGVPVHARAEFLRANIDLTADTIRIAIFDDSTAYSFDANAHSTVADVLDGGTTATEMSGTGYSRQTLTTLSVTEDSTDTEGVWDADDVTFTGLDAGTIQGYILYQQVGGDDTTPGDDPIVQVVDDTDSGSLPLTTNGSDVVIEMNAEGILNLQ